MTRKKKIAFSAITLLLAVFAIEGSARLYAAFRHDNANALTYGFDFARRIVTEPDDVQQNRPFADVAKQEATADQIFARRNDPSHDDGWVEHLGGRQVLAGNIMASVNRQHFRGGEFPTSDDGTPRIGIYGGSFVFGHGLADDETWPFLLEKQLRGGGNAVHVFNLGENGSNIHGVLINLVRTSKRLPLDYAVLVSAYNNHALLRIERRQSWAKVADFYLYNLSMFHVLAKEKLSVARGQPVDYGLYRQQVSVEPDAVESLITSYRKRLAQAALVCRERGIQLVFAAQPQVFFDARIDALDMFDTGAVQTIHDQIARGEPLWLMDLEFYLQARLNMEARAAATAEGASFVDLANLFRGNKQPSFLDQIHPNRDGSQKLAAALGEFFARRVPQTTTQ